MADVHKIHGGDESIEELEAARLRVQEEEADRQAAQEEADGQFALEIPESGKKVSWGSLIPRGTPVEVKYKRSGKSIPNVKGGLLEPDTQPILLSTEVVESYVIKFTRDDDLVIEKATLYVQIGARHVVNAHSEAGEVMLGKRDAA